MLAIDTNTIVRYLTADHPEQFAKASALIAGEQWNQPLLAELSQVMRDASICGLGQAAPNPVDCVIKFFPNELN